MEPGRDSNWTDLGSNVHQPSPSQEQIGHNSTRKRPRSERGEPGTLRTAIACQACRDRKTRCSGDQPACNYCRRIGIDCLYNQGGAVKPAPNISNSPATLDDWGTKILSAIDHLAGSLKTNQITNYGNRREISTSTGQDTNSFLSNKEQTSLSISICSPTVVTSVSSILSWDVFKSCHEAAAFSVPSQAPPRRPQNRGQESGSTATSHLISLSRAFASHFSWGSPILDMLELESYIFDIGENGAAWTAESCLVFLVAALGSLCHGTSDSIDAGFRYWNMAKKRLGWALEGESLLSARCLLLAGIWYLHNSEPENACRMLHNANLLINGCISSSQSNQNDQAWAQQQILETCLELQCKLQSEFATTSTSPMQSLDIAETTQSSPSSSHDSEITRLFRKSNLFLLHLRQAILASCKALNVNIAWEEVSGLSTDLSLLQRRLDDWYDRLPPLLKFSQSTQQGINSLSAEDIYHSLIQSRYCEVKELILRPWLYIRLHLSNKLQLGGNLVGCTTDQAMYAHFIARSDEMTVQHQQSILVRLKDELCNWKEKSTGLLEGRWLQASNLFVLALLLLAPSLQNSETSVERDFMSPGWTSSLWAIEDSFRLKGASDLEKQYAILLQTLIPK